MVRAVDKADAMLTLSSALYNIGSHLPFNIDQQIAVAGLKHTGTYISDKAQLAIF